MPARTAPIRIAAPLLLSAALAAPAPFTHAQSPDGPAPAADATPAPAPNPDASPDRSAHDRPRRGVLGRGPMSPGLAEHPERLREFAQALQAIDPQLHTALQNALQQPQAQRQQSVIVVMQSLSDEQRRQLRETMRTRFRLIRLEADPLGEGFAESSALGPDAFGDPGRSGRDRGAGRWLTDEDFDELVGVIKQIRPDWSERIAKLRQNDRRGLYEAMHSNKDLARLAALIKLKDRAPETYAMRLDELRLSIQMENAAYAAHLARQSGDASAINTTQNQLRAAVESYFDARINAREHEIEQVRQQLVRMQANVEAAKEIRHRSIDEKVQSLLADDAFESLKTAQGPMKSRAEVPGKGPFAQSKTSGEPNGDTHARPNPAPDGQKRNPRRRPPGSSKALKTSEAPKAP